MTVHIFDRESTGGTSFALRSLIAMTGAFLAAGAWPAPAHADTAGVSNLLNSTGISQLIEQIGQQICPMLVKPGSSLVSNATTASGHGGLASQVTGFVAEQAIRSQCPAVMTELANGNFAPLMQMLSTANQASGALNQLNGVSVPSVPLPAAGVLSP
ncbi:DUF732 domain-containing protein [Mycolicibacterium aichiense]|uniref:DUF732 domain-containing protein n=1 Tax=Mycolicibacterium aichiense TaxID=1799 RepID=A0AAD1HIF0_9MYCO|nr:DUF732 domain-containing protein [Mycolicibacterium aichiense]MCV7020751.1 DUF732 domain-containing protein [Mycolicibacterium aichiense]BBX05319.1 hypothetical protein MAIC_01220 [Mycolicibacterium aichiense]STZ25330.1 Protein of uncharacterised function (DUF732) [Mycolicibacterium aichiense]